MTDKLRVMACAPGFGAPGDIANNTSAILSRVREAREAGAGLLLLPELCVSSGSCGDMFHHEALLSSCEDAAKTIVAESKGLICVFGLPLRTEKGVISAAAIAFNERLIGFAAKKNLSPDQVGIFSSACPAQIMWLGEPFPCSPVFTMKLPEHPHTTLEVCFYDDLNKIDNIENSVITILARHPARAGQHSERAFEIAQYSTQGSTLLYANAGVNESTSDQVYEGRAVIAQASRVLAETIPFSGIAALADLSIQGLPIVKNKPKPIALDTRGYDPQTPYAPAKGEARAAWCRDCVEIAARGLLCRMERIGIKSAVLGVSGGLDSALALLVTKRMFDIAGFDPEDLLACTLPALGSTARTGGNAQKLIESLKLKARNIDLKVSILQHFRDIGHPENQYDAAYENAQARERTQVLMDLANMVNGLMVGTGDMSELALGFTTFGGDQMSMYGVNGGLYKTAIRMIVAQYAQDTENMALKEVLLDILDTPISPELLPPKGEMSSQHTEQILGPYLLNDFFLHHFLKNRLGPAELLKQALIAFDGVYSKLEITDFMRGFFLRFFQNQFKRSCLPDGPQVLDISLSPRGGLNLPSDMSADVFLEAIDRLSAVDKT